MGCRFGGFILHHGTFSSRCPQVEEVTIINHSSEIVHVAFVLPGSVLIASFCKSETREHD